MAELPIPGVDGVLGFGVDGIGFGKERSYCEKVRLRGSTVHAQRQVEISCHSHKLSASGSEVEEYEQSEH